MYWSELFIEPCPMVDSVACALKELYLCIFCYGICKSLCWQIHYSLLNVSCLFTTGSTHDLLHHIQMDRCENKGNIIKYFFFIFDDVVDQPQSSKDLDLCLAECHGAHCTELYPSQNRKQRSHQWLVLSSLHLLWDTNFRALKKICLLE